MPRHKRAGQRTSVDAYRLTKLHGVANCDAHAAKLTPQGYAVNVFAHYVHHTINGMPVRRS